MTHPSASSCAASNLRAVDAWMLSGRSWPQERITLSVIDEGHGHCYTIARGNDRTNVIHLFDAMGKA